jgi:hypothetical protein
VLNSDWLSLECADGNKKGKTKNLSKQWKNIKGIKTCYKKAIILLRATMAIEKHFRASVL